MVTLEQIKSKLNEPRLEILNEFDDYAEKKREGKNDSNPTKIGWEIFADGYIQHINSMNGYFVSCSHFVNNSINFAQGLYLMYLETWMYKETIYPILETAMKEVLKESSI